MDRAITSLLKSAAANSAAQQTAALFQLAMLLEKNTRPSDESGFYETVLPPALLPIRLDVDAQAQILLELAKRATADGVPSAVLWAMGKALPKAAAPVLADLVTRHAELAEDAEAAYQAIIALENCLDYDREQGRSQDVAALSENTTVLDFVRQAADSPDPRLAEHAPRILRRLTRPSHGR
jgi:hypothetical protein